MTVLPGAAPLQLLGVAQWKGRDQRDRAGTAGTARRLERKMAGLLTYLALEGDTPRTVLAGLLWPEANESTARSNLRQTLRRARELMGADVIVGDEHLKLGAVQVDAAALELAAFSGQDAQALAFEGELLGGHDFDDCPEFLEWLFLQRERLSGLRREARTRQSEAAEERGEYRTALLHAEKLLELDPVSEVAHRRLMRLHYLLGDRGAALQAFSRCVQTLQRELGVPPMPETLALAAQIEAQDTLPSGREESRAGLPLEVQRPPLLIGRAAEWAVLETAWARRQAIFISGPAGIGKTRLAQEFLQRMGAFQSFEGQLGDRGVPYASLSRAFRQLLGGLPELPLEDWVRRELSRLLPELGHAPAPMNSEEDRLRFHEAQAKLVAAALERTSGSSGTAHHAGAGTHLLIDDLQFHDEVSLDAWSFILAHPLVQACGVRVVFTFRQGELPPARLAAVQASLAAGQSVRIELRPLSTTETQTLLDSLHLRLPGGLAPALERHTGGNPLFLLETLRSLIETGELERAQPARLPVPRRLGPLLARRLERLSPAAARLASAAAVAGPDFTPELAAAVLELHPLDLATPWTELISAQVLSSHDEQRPLGGQGGHGFTHDLLAEAALANLPAPIRGLLHRRVAAYLEALGAEPARVAHHWQAAGDGTLAAPWWLKAGQAALLRGADADAAAAFERTLEGIAPGPQSQQAQAARLLALLGLGKALLGRDPDASLHHLNAALHEAQARSDTVQEIEAHAALCEWHLLRGELRQSHQAILRALELLPPDLTGLAEAQRRDASELWRARFWVELRSGRLAQAEQAIGTAMTLAPTHPWLANERALLLWHAGRFPEAAEVFETLMHRSAPDAEATLPWIANNMAWTYWALSRNQEAAALLERSLEKPGAPFDRGLRLSNLSVILTSQGRYREALAHLHEARTLLGGYNLNMADVLYRLGVVHYRADQRAQALAYFEQASDLARQVGDLYRLAYTLASTAALQAWQGQLTDAHTHIQEAQGVAQRIQYPLATIITEQASSEIARLAGEQDAALAHARTGLHLARACQIPEQLGYAHLSAALVPGAHAVADAQAALEVGQRYDLPDLTWRAAQLLNKNDVVGHTLALLRTQAPEGWY